MGHLHILNPKQKPSIQKELNYFLKEHNFSKKNIIAILQKITQYIQYFSHKAHTLIKKSYIHLQKKENHISINLITQAFPEIDFEISKIENVFQHKYLNYYDAIHCLPLIHLTLTEIITHIHKNHSL